jgi:hypothetical protein
MANITIPSDLLGQFVGIILFETSLIIGLLIQEQSHTQGNNRLTFIQQLEGWKIGSGIFACGIAILVFLKEYPFILPSAQSEGINVIGFGLFWIGLTLIVNGMFTQKQAFHSIEKKLDNLIKNTKL